MKDDYTINSDYLTYRLLFRKVGRMYFLNLGVKGFFIAPLPSYNTLNFAFLGGNMDPPNNFQLVWSNQSALGCQPAAFATVTSPRQAFGTNTTPRGSHAWTTKPRAATEGGGRPRSTAGRSGCRSTSGQRNASLRSPPKVASRSSNTSLATSLCTVKMATVGPRIPNLAELRYSTPSWCLPFYNLFLVSQKWA